jgi:NAD(P)-dependent dehydrogenase (short-subunit alcohol dehydrogenase family)
VLTIPPWLTGRVALVTGAGGPPDAPAVARDADPGQPIGTGRAIARLLALAGAHVIVMDRDATAAAVTRDEIVADGGAAMMSVVDVSDAASVRGAMAAVRSTLGRLDVLVNNAAVTSAASIGELSGGEWDRVLDVNLRGAMHLCAEAIPIMRDGGGGAVINLVSAAALRGFDTPAYAASKGGLLALTTDLAASQGQYGIRVNAVLPGHVRTPMAVSRGTTEAAREQRRRASPLLNEGNGWDVAWAVLFLASDASRWTTGATIPVDAGMLISAPMSVGQWGGA